MNNQTEHHSSGTARALPGSTVLHIDDDPNDSELLRAAAHRAGIPLSVQNIEDADQAVAYLAGKAPYENRERFPLPSLILLDLKMPRATGFEVLRWVRSHPKHSNLPIVVLSGSELHEDMRQAYSIGADSYVVKPIGFDALVSLVQNLHVTWLAAAAATSLV